MSADILLLSDFAEMAIPSPASCARQPVRQEILPHGQDLSDFATMSETSASRTQTACIPNTMFSARTRSQLVFGAALALVVSLSGVRSVAAEADAPAVDLVLEPLSMPQGFQLPGFGGGRFGGDGGASFGGSLFGDLGSFFGGLRFGSSSGGDGGDGGSSGGGGGGTGGGGGFFSGRQGDASGLFPGRF
jgi:hypothetical protein